jgi:hypothetical protein
MAERVPSLQEFKQMVIELTQDINGNTAEPADAETIDWNKAYKEYLEANRRGEIRSKKRAECAKYEKPQNGIKPYSYNQKYNDCMIDAIEGKID